MEHPRTLILIALVLSVLSFGETVRRSGAVGCCLHTYICREEEYCDKAAYYPFGKCKRNLFGESQVVRSCGEYRREENNADGEPSGDLTERSTTDDSGTLQYDNGDPNSFYWKNKYNLTYFENYDSSSENRREIIHTGIDNKRVTARNSDVQNINRAYRGQQDNEHNGNYIGQVSAHNIGKKWALEREKHNDDGLPHLATVLAREEHQSVEVRNSKPRGTKVVHRQKTTEPEKRYQQPELEKSLDFDIEIKPLSLSDTEYFEDVKSKLSAIPDTPAVQKDYSQKLEHIKTNIVATSPAKKAKVGVLIGGHLDQAKANIIHQKSPDQTYDKVKDFFKSQQVSSIVDAPVAEKKQNVKFNALLSENKDGNVKRSSIPTPSVYPDGIKLVLKERLDHDKTSDVLNTLQDLLWGPNGQRDAFTTVQTEDRSVYFHVLNNTTSRGERPSSVVERINRDDSLKSALRKAVGVTVLSASLQSKELEQVKEDDSDFMITTFIVAGCVTGILLASVCIFIILKRTQGNSNWAVKEAGQEVASDYQYLFTYVEHRGFCPRATSTPRSNTVSHHQSLWRQLREATRESSVHTTSSFHSDNSDQTGILANRGMPPKYSWSEEPVDTKMDISTGHVVLSYMEDHLKNENRLSKEWKNLCVYEAEPNSTDVGKDSKNSKKNRYSDVLPFDHSRVKLRETANATGSDYINANYIIDDDPRNPAYIATQGPLGSTVADFWQMVWEQGVVVIVMLTKLADLGLPQCHRYWPEKGHEVYHIYQVHLISEHIWCTDFLVRSFYLKNVQTSETRTVTQFHYLTWPHLGIPVSSKPLLDFRRKVLKCFRSPTSPVVVHCSGGIDRTGTYILIDMVLSKMSRGTKEIDIAATLEHLRDHRPQMVKTKAQFEFALASVAEEVNAILQVLTKH